MRVLKLLLIILIAKFWTVSNGAKLKLSEFIYTFNNEYFSFVNASMIETQLGLLLNMKSEIIKDMPVVLVLTLMYLFFVYIYNFNRSRFKSQFKKLRT